MRRFGPLPEVALVLAVTAAVFALSGATEPSAAASAASGGGAEVDGGEIYGRDCAGCHGPEGEGSGRGIPLLESGEASAHYMLVTGRMPISDPEEPIRRGPPHYTDDQIRALVEHVAGLGDGPALPEIDGTDGDVPTGGHLYRLHCGMCHGATGIGGAMAFDEFAPELSESEPSVIAAAVTAGPGAMPSFRPLGLDDSEVASIVAYLETLQHPDDRGGWPIFRAGRADEGMVALLIVMPGLLLTAAWLARRVR